MVRKFRTNSTLNQQLMATQNLQGTMRSAYTRVCNLTCCTALYRTRHDLSCEHCTAAGITAAATSSRDSTLASAPAASTAPKKRSVMQLQQVPAASISKLAVEGH